MFTEIQDLKSVYKTDKDDLIKDFYIPVLKEAVLYDRAVGFFSSAILAYAAEGIAALISNGGRMRLIIGAEIDAEEYDAIQNGYEIKNALDELSVRIGNDIINSFEIVENSLALNRLDALTWLIAHDKLDIKVAIRRRGMFHEKIGIMVDREGNKIVFQGSANETPYALRPDYNFESINVFKSWKDSEDHLLPHIESFEELWNAKSKNTLIISFPNNAKKWLVKKSASIEYKPSPEIEEDVWEKWSGKTERTEKENLPCIPITFHGLPFTIKEHQKNALKQWQGNDGKGILSLVTGAGKTITSIYGAVKIFEASKKLFLIISVPYVNLADQWCETLKDFNIYPIQCYNSKNFWSQRLHDSITSYLNDSRKFEAVIVVNRTLQNKYFQAEISRIPGDCLMFVGDECHHHSSKGLYASLPKQARLRLGLSATPYNYMDTEANKRLDSYYNGIVATYTLKDAIEQGVLTPYKYYLHTVPLDPDEQDKYIEISSNIAKMLASGASFENEILSALLRKRARLLGNARKKMQVFADILNKTEITPYTLFFCGDGTTEGETISGEKELLRQVSQVAAVAQKFGWKTSRFTSDETKKERDEILDNFKNKVINALVAIRCLDEGFDVPACRTAFLLASARNPRQFIQRRGRILRRYNGKKEAIIHDFLVYIPLGKMNEDVGKFEKALLIEEIKRIKEFADTSENFADAYTVLKDLCKKYDLVI